MFKNEKVVIQRDAHGVPHIEAKSERDLFWGQGWAHAHDRGVQMVLMRILAQGRGAELLDGSDEMLGIDTFFRRMNWTGKTRTQIDALPPDARRKLDAYCAGINASFDEKYPWEFKRLLGVKPEPWTPADVVTISRMIGYLTLAQSQTEIERLLVEMVQADVPQEKLEDLFPGLLGGLDRELIKKVKLQERLITPESLWEVGMPRMMASNNWVVSGSKTVSGLPILANDPHLEINRLPGVWQELVLRLPDNYMMGGSMPGFPGILVGRNKNLAWGATYAFIDACDSWIEKCRDGKFFREKEGQWLPFHRREEVIRRKKKEPVTVTFYENLHGVLEGDPYVEGYYLTTRWAPGESGNEALKCMLGMISLKTVDDGMNAAGPIETAWNLVFAGKNGDIGFQMTGMAPKRRKGVSGLVPLPGWKKENDWQGFYGFKDLPRIKNPTSGFFATANQDLNQYGKISPINMPMGPYRWERICQLLENKEKLEVEDMFAMHADVYSLQAESFMKILKPLLPETPQGNILAEWDLCYDADSQGAYLFEVFYKALFREVFGKMGFGEAATRFILEGNSLFIDFYRNLDDVLLSEHSVWFEGESREELYKRVAVDNLDIEVKTWGAAQQYMMSHVLFGGKFPRFFGFDRGPFTGTGGRATIHQGQIYRSAGRVTTFMPSYRFVTELAEETAFSNLAGGPSDRRFSKWYCTDLENWLNYRYKTVIP